MLQNLGKLHKLHKLHELFVHLILYNNFVILKGSVNYKRKGSTHNYKW